MICIANFIILWLGDWYGQIEKHLRRQVDKSDRMDQGTAGSDEGKGLAQSTGCAQWSVD